MLSCRLPKDLQKMLDDASEETHRPKSYYVIKALREFFENRQDYLAAVAALEQMGDEKPVPFDEMMKKIGLSEDDYKN